MSRVEEIEQALAGLSAEEFRSLAEWMRERDQELWDRQMDEDSASGKLGACLTKQRLSQTEWTGRELAQRPPNPHNHPRVRTNSRPALSAGVAVHSSPRSLTASTSHSAPALSTLILPSWLTR